MPVVTGEGMSGTWTQAMLAPVVLGALAYVLLQKGVLGSKGLVVAGATCIILAVVLALGFSPTTFEASILSAFSVVALAGGFGFLIAREPVYAALGFATAVLSTCGVLFMQEALFIAAATMIVYAGATIIIFLFVLMFAQQTNLQSYDIQLTNPVFASVIGATLLAAIVVCVTGQNEVPPVRVDLTRKMSLVNIPNANSTTADASDSNPTAPVKRVTVDTIQTRGITTAGLGRSLYTDYLLAVELAGTVLLVATIGAMALAQKNPERSA